MKCTRCEHELPVSALFCGKCGTPVTKTVAPTPVEPPIDASVGLSAAHSAQAQQAAARIQAAKWEEQRLTLMQIQSTINSLSQAQTSHKQDLDARLQRLSQDADERQIEINHILMATRNLESRLNQFNQSVHDQFSQAAALQPTTPMAWPDSIKIDPQDKSALMQVMASLQSRVEALGRDLMSQLQRGSEPLVHQVSASGESSIDVQAMLRVLREGWDQSWQEHVLLLNERLSTDMPTMFSGGSSEAIDEAALAARLSATVDASVRVALSERALKGPDLSGITLEFGHIRQDLHRMASTLERVVNHQSEQTERHTHLIRQELASLNEGLQARMQNWQAAMTEQITQQLDERLQGLATQFAAKPAAAPERMQKLEPRLESRLEALFHHAPGASKDKAATTEKDNSEAIPVWLWLVLGGVSTVTVVLGITAAVKLLGGH